MKEVEPAADAMVTVDDGARLRTWTTGLIGPTGTTDDAADVPPVILLHGGPGMWDYLEPIARMLEPITVVHRFDQRGCGGSDPCAPDQHTIARYIADIEALRRHWGYDVWTVVGHSFGATLAFAYAVAHPGRTAAMGYVNGVSIGDWHPRYQQERLRRMTPEQRIRLAALKAAPYRSPDEEVEFRTLSWFTDYADPVRGWELALAAARIDRPLNLDANRRLNAEVAGLSAVDTMAQAGTLPMPCWFIHGTGDPRPTGTVADLARAVPASQLHLIDGAGHEPWYERPDELRHLLAGLLAASRKPNRGATSPA
jgi:proline iminopeptidase